MNAFRKKSKMEREEKDHPKEKINIRLHRVIKNKKEKKGT